MPASFQQDERFRACDARAQHWPPASTIPGSDRPIAVIRLCCSGRPMGFWTIAGLVLLAGAGLALVILPSGAMNPAYDGPREFEYDGETYIWLPDEAGVPRLPTGICMEASSMLTAVR